MFQTQHRQAVRLTTTALCIALGLLLPTVFHVFGTGAGTALLPMHLPVLLCGLLCGWQYGAACGILVPLLIGCIMRFPQGSGTTAMITGSAIIAPMVLTLGINPYLAGLAVCLTAMCPSFLNDSYFHVVTNLSGMDIKTSLKTWTMGSIAVPVFGSIIICILSIFFH